VIGDGTTSWTRAILHSSSITAATLRAFLDHLLNGNYSDAQLQELYRKGDADIGFRGEELRSFLGLTRATIDRDT
jgi:hypothetical protein